MIHEFLQETAGEVPKNLVHEEEAKLPRVDHHGSRATVRRGHTARGARVQIRSVFSKRRPNYEALMLVRRHFENYQLRTVTLSMLEAECAFPLSSTSTQLPPRWLPVRPGTHTMCFPPFATLPAWDVCLRSKFN